MKGTFIPFFLTTGRPKRAFLFLPHPHTLGAPSIALFAMGGKAVAPGLPPLRSALALAQKVTYIHPLAAF